MRIVVLTGSQTGIAAYAVPALVEAGLEISMVIFNQGQIRNRTRHYSVKIKKLQKIGIGGAVIGFVMRKWFGKNMQRYLDPVLNLEEYCCRNNILFTTTSCINCDTTIALFQQANADVGLSLSNSFIAPKIFSLCRYGMVNVHGEILPDYQNAQSVIWQIYNGSNYTGYTIHKIERKIDAGDILYQKRLPIIFRDTLSDTVSYNCAAITKASVQGIAEFFSQFEHYYKNSVVQNNGRSYTTPSLRQFRQMQRQFNILKKGINAYGR